MGNCFGRRGIDQSPSGSTNASKDDPAISPAPKHEPPDDQLSPDWEYVTALGTGGSGETGLFRHTRNGEEVAIKLMKRPVPRVVLPHLQRELQVQI